MTETFTPQPAQRILFEGRYRKLIRGLPQTTFFCPECRGRGCDHCEGFGRLTRDSVQDWIARIALPRFKARRQKFHGAGREDMDVRMLGNGRPFVFEMLKVKRPEIDLDQLAVDVFERSEGAVELLGLQYCDRKRIAVVKEEHHTKTYRAKVVFPDGTPHDLASRLDHLQEQSRLEVVQRTPQRVAHRRADKERMRWLELQNWELQGEDLLVDLLSAHGTYIKEFISGDNERSQPSLASLLGATAHCQELDVLAIG